MISATLCDMVMLVAEGIALRIWVYSSLLYPMAGCFLFSGKLNLTLEKLLCSVPMLPEVLYVILQKH